MNPRNASYTTVDPASEFSYPDNGTRTVTCLGAAVKRGAQAFRDKYGLNYRKQNAFLWKIIYLENISSLQQTKPDWRMELLLFQASASIKLFIDAIYSIYSRYFKHNTRIIYFNTEFNSINNFFLDCNLIFNFADRRSVLQLSCLIYLCRFFLFAKLSSSFHLFYTYFLLILLHVAQSIRVNMIWTIDGSNEVSLLLGFALFHVVCETSVPASTIFDWTFDMCFFSLIRFICGLEQSAKRKNICVNWWERWSARILWIRFQVQMPMRFPGVSQM